jgi:hypothetical protein
MRHIWSSTGNGLQSHTGLSSDSQPVEIFLKCVNRELENFIVNEIYANQQKVEVKHNKVNWGRFIVSSISLVINKEQNEDPSSVSPGYQILQNVSSLHQSDCRQVLCFGKADWAGSNASGQNWPVYYQHVWYMNVFQYVYSSSAYTGTCTSNTENTELGLSGSLAFITVLVGFVVIVFCCHISSPWSFCQPSKVYFPAPILLCQNTATCCLFTVNKHGTAHTLTQNITSDHVYLSCRHYMAATCR